MKSKGERRLKERLSGKEQDNRIFSQESCQPGHNKVHFLLRGSSAGFRKVVSVGPSAVHSTMAPCSLVPAK